MLWRILTIFACLVVLGHSATLQNYTAVYNQIFGNYNNRLRPVLEGATTLNVSASLVLLSLDSVSEKEQTMTTSGWLNLQWIDEILTWNASSYGGVIEVVVQQQNIWRPDVVIKNSVKQRGMMGYNEQPVAITNLGEVIWAPGDIYETSCDLDVTYYPFDIQTCKISIYLWLSTAVEIALTSRGTTLDMEMFSENGQWEVVGTSAVTDTAAIIPEVTFTLRLKRRHQFYVVNIIVPILFLSCLGPLVFALPADSGEKMGFSITTLLAFTVFLTIIGDSMPKTSTQTSVLSVYLSAMMAISALSVILSAVSLRIYHKPEDTEPPRAARTVCRSLRKVLCMTAGKSRTNIVTTMSTSKPMSELSSDHVMEDEITWKMVSEVMDTFFLVLFSVITVLITIPSLVSMAKGAE